MTAGVIALLAALALAVIAGAGWKLTNGRMRTIRLDDKQPGADQPASASPPVSLSAGQLGQPLGERATLLQFSSAFCAPCRATRVILADVAGRAPGVTHLEIDAESHLDLVRSLGVLRTPTVFVLGADGAITARASGLPRKADVLGALGAALPARSSYSPGLETG